MSVRKTERIPVMFDQNFVRDVDDWRFENRVSTRAEAIRTLIKKGLSREKENEKPPASS